MFILNAYRKALNPISSSLESETTKVPKQLLKQWMFNHHILNSSICITTNQTAQICHSIGTARCDITPYIKALFGCSQSTCVGPNPPNTCGL